MKTMMTVEDYLKLPYAVDIHWDSDDEFYVARVAEISECMGHGNSRSDAMDMAFDNLRDWIEDALESGAQIPVPVPSPELPSGKWLQRVPRTLHLELTKLAAQDGVSLNQWVVVVLSREAGYRAGSESQQITNLEGAADPSTGYLSLVRNEIAVIESWEIRDRAKPAALMGEYVHKLVEGLPSKSNLESSGRYGQENDHAKWN